MNNNTEKETASPLQKDLARKILFHMVDQNWEIGQKISAPALARHFNVSRSPIVGALQILSHKKLLGPRKTRGLEIITDISKIDIHKLIPDSHLEELYKIMMHDRATGKLDKEVTEAELMPRYNVSRGIIRKLLMRFTTEGLAHRMQGHGWQFVDILENNEATRESYEFRIIIECAALKDPNYTVDINQLMQVKKAHENVINGKNTSINSDEWFQINSKFHEILTRFSGNRYLTNAIIQQNNLRRMKETSLYESLPVSRVRQSCEEHLEIISAVETGDYSWAESLMRQHLRKSLNF